MSRPHSQDIYAASDPTSGPGDLYGVLVNTLARLVAAREEFDRGTADQILWDIEVDLVGYLAREVA